MTERHPNILPALILAVNRSGIFPDRSLQRLGNTSVLAHIVQRLHEATRVGEIILCTSENPEDDSLVALAKTLDLRVVRGPHANLVQRLLRGYDEGGIHDAIVVRGDTPFVDPSCCDRLVDEHLAHRSQYSYSEHLQGLPYGLGCEVVSRPALNRMAQIDTKGNLSDRYGILMRLHAKELKTFALPFSQPQPDLRFAIETHADMDFANELIKLAPDNPGVADLLETIARHPFLPSLNRIQNTTREIGLEKLALFPEKLSSMTEATFDTSYPISVELSLTNACNLKCQWCSDSQLRKTRPGAIPFRAYSNLVDDLAAHGTRGLVLEGGGEPTVHPQFRDAVQLAADKGLAVGVITNGVKFDYIDLLPKLEWIRVSLDADCAETFHRIKGYDYFYQVMANIRSMCEARQSCVIGIGYVVSNQNLEHLEEITMLLCEYGADYIYLRPVIDHPELRINRDLLYLKKYETDQFSVMIHAMAENSVTGNSGVPCVANSLSSVICADGSVFLCGRLNIHPWVKPIGNICTESFDALWHGEERRRQTAKAMDAGFCRQWCPECRLTKYNTILAATRRIRTRNFI